MSRIVVGIDDSAGARAALAFALDEARWRDARLSVVNAWVMPFPLAVPGLVLGGFPVEGDTRLDDISAATQAGAAALIDRALEEVDAETSGVDVERLPLEGDTAAVLLEAAADADLLVVGSRGRGGFRGLLLGSVSQTCAHHSPCPLVVVPTPTAEDG
ncbi:MAG: universal stress protein [Gaiellales bacterium]